MTRRVTVAPPDLEMGTGDPEAFVDAYERYLGTLLLTQDTLGTYQVTTTPAMTRALRNRLRDGRESLAMLHRAQSHIASVRITLDQSWAKLHSVWRWWFAAVLLHVWAVWALSTPAAVCLP